MNQQYRSRSASRHYLVEAQDLQLKEKVMWCQLMTRYKPPRHFLLHYRCFLLPHDPQVWSPNFYNIDSVYSQLITFHQLFQQEPGGPQNTEKCSMIVVLGSEILRVDYSTPIVRMIEGVKFDEVPDCIHRANFFVGHSGVKMFDHGFVHPEEGEHVDVTNWDQNFRYSDERWECGRIEHLCALLVLRPAAQFVHTIALGSREVFDQGQFTPYSELGKLGFHPLGSLAKWEKPKRILIVREHLD